MPDDVSRKWVWMMDYCKKNGMAPAQAWAWEQAGAAYSEALEVGE